MESGITYNSRLWKTPVQNLFLSSPGNNRQNHLPRPGRYTYHRSRSPIYSHIPKCYTLPQNSLRPGIDMAGTRFYLHPQFLRVIRCCRRCCCHHCCRHHCCCHHCYCRHCYCRHCCCHRRCCRLNCNSGQSPNIVRYLSERSWFRHCQLYIRIDHHLQGTGMYR